MNDNSKLFRCVKCRQSMTAMRDVSVDGNCLHHGSPVDEEITFRQFMQFAARHRPGWFVHVYPLTVHIRKQSR